MDTHNQEIPDVESLVLEEEALVATKPSNEATKQTSVPSPNPLNELTIPKSTRTKLQDSLLRMLKQSTRAREYDFSRAIVLGQGGQGVSFLVKSLSTGEPHVAKCTQVPIGVDTDSGEWDRETEILRQLDSEYLCKFKDVELLGDGQWIASYREFGEGPTLREHIKRNGRLTPDQALFVLREVLKGLAYLHNHKLQDGGDSCVIHRDIKPENIVVKSFKEESPDSSGVKIIDFGIAVLLEDSSTPYMTTSVKGTEQYMPIEQMYLNMPTVRSDIYSLGITIVESLLGKIPKRLTEALLNGESFKFQGNEGIPEELAQVLERMIEYHESKRFQSASDVLAILPLSCENLSDSNQERYQEELENRTLPEECPFNREELEFIVEQIPAPLKAVLRSKSQVFEDPFSLKVLGALFALCSQKAGAPIEKNESELYSRLVLNFGFFHDTYNSSPNTTRIPDSNVASFVSPLIDEHSLEQILRNLASNDIVERKHKGYGCHEAGFTEIGKQSLALYYLEKYLSSLPRSDEYAETQEST